MNVGDLVTEMNEASTEMQRLCRENRPDMMPDEYYVALRKFNECRSRVNEIQTELSRPERLQMRELSLEDLQPGTVLSIRTMSMFVKLPDCEFERIEGTANCVEAKISFNLTGPQTGYTLTLSKARLHESPQCQAAQSRGLPEVFLLHPSKHYSQDNLESLASKMEPAMDVLARRWAINDLGFIYPILSAVASVFGSEATESVIQISNIA